MTEKHDRTEEVYQAICDWKEAHGGEAPTLADLSGKLGIGKTTVLFYMTRLADAGRIIYGVKSRSIGIPGEMWMPPLQQEPEPF